MEKKTKLSAWEIGKKIEEILYERFCNGCPDEHYCHNACENCDEYADAYENFDLKELENE